MMSRNTSRSRIGFTLVELLVVIGIIALLISILLPALTRARRAANTVACGANLRSILQGMHTYAAQNNGYFPGGANTSAVFMLQPHITQANCPGVSQIWDWQAPIGKTMGFKFNEGPTPADRVARATYLWGHPAFTCPENKDVLATAFVNNGSPNFPATQWISYCTPISFHLLNSNATFSGQIPAGYGATQTVRSPSFYNTPPGYSPKLTKIGKPSRKIYIADGARFSTGTPPTMNLDFFASTGGAYADAGAWSMFSRAYDRKSAPGNGGSSAVPDARVLSYRHGQRAPGGKADTFKMNCGFFDGHVELLGDLESANPVFWMPRGTSHSTNQGEMYRDARTRFPAPDPSIINE